jgi:hypothetical protein
MEIKSQRDLGKPAIFASRTHGLGHFRRFGEIASATFRHIIPDTAETKIAMTGVIGPI